MNERIRKYLQGVAGSGPILPVLVLTAIYFFDEFDTAAFGVLAPTIERVFGLTDAEFGTIVIGNLSFVLLLAIPVGYLGDRVSRRNVTVVVRRPRRGVLGADRPGRRARVPRRRSARQRRRQPRQRHDPQLAAERLPQA